MQFVEHCEVSNEKCQCAGAGRFENVGVYALFTINLNRFSVKVFLYSISVNAFTFSCPKLFWVCYLGQKNKVTGVFGRVDLFNTFYF